MNSCDEDYDYPEYDRHPRRKGKFFLSFFNFSNLNLNSLDRVWSPSADYDRQYQDPRCWSPNDEDDRRSFDRYDRYGPQQSKSLTAYERRELSRRKYRERSRMDYPYEDHPYDDHEPGPPIPRGGKRNNYENVYEFDRSLPPPSSSLRDARRDYFYNKDQSTKSFESTESYDSRGRPNSFGSGEIYGGYEREYRDRYHAEKGRLLKGRNARSKPDLDLDSDNEFGGNRRDMDGGSLQRVRGGPKANEESAWSGKQWKRPSSATDQASRPIDPRRVPPGAILPPGSDGEKDRRFRRKTRPIPRKDEDYLSNYATMRYPPARSRRDDYYDYDPEEVNDPYYPHFGRQGPGGPKADGRSMNEGLDKRYDYPPGDGDQRPSRGGFKKSNSRDFLEQKDRFAKFPEEIRGKGGDFDRDSPSPYQPPPPSSNNSKFANFEKGFESDFSATPSSHGTNKNFKYPGEYEEKSPKNFANFDNFTMNTHAAANNTQQKLRFNEKVQVSQFDSNESSANMFEDDFSTKTDIKSEADDKWNELPTPKSLRTHGRLSHENIKKSESINIFAKRTDDPFEDDPFFGSSTNNATTATTTTSNNVNNNLSGNTSNGKDSSNDRWSKNFANFEDNM